MTTRRVPVVIAGGGSVGLSLAAELGWRNVECLVAERMAGLNTHPRANAVANRTMEYYRRWGIDTAITKAGIPPHLPANYYYVYLALFPAVLWTNRADWNAAFRMLLVFGMLIAISVSTWMGAGWPVQNGWINGSILTFFVLLLASLAVDRGLGTDRADLPGVSTG